MTKKRKHRLTDVPESSFVLIAIVSACNDYRLSWLLNQGMNFQFIRKNDLELKDSKKDVHTRFSLYEYEDQNSFLHYRLLSNKSPEGVFLQEFKNIDFILHITGEINEEITKELITGLKKIDEINLAFEINHEHLKKPSIKKLIF